MQQLTRTEMGEVSGGGTTSNMAISLPADWTSLAAGLIAGNTMPGTSKLAGGVIDFDIGAVKNIGYGFG